MEDDIVQDILLSCSIGDLYWLKKSLIGREKFINQMFNNEGLNPFHIVAYSRNLALMEYLTSQCIAVIDVNIGTLYTGDTPLHLLLSTTCCSSNNNVSTNGADSMEDVIQCVQLLLNKGANYDKQNYKRQTPLHLAAKSGLTPVVALLIEEGANFTITDNRNQSPNDMARLYGNYECSRMLSALDWAKDKDSSLRHRLQTERQNTKERTLQKKIQSHLKKQQGDMAYETWLDQNGFSPPPLFSATTSKTRLSCKTCLTPSTPGSTTNEQINETNRPIPTIQLSLNQAEHNVQSIGKPDKMYPYSNYPPTKYRIHSASSSGRNHTTSRPHSCATSGRVTPKKSTSSLRAKSAPTRLTTPTNNNSTKNTTNSRPKNVNTDYKGKVTKSLSSQRFKHQKTTSEKLNTKIEKKEEKIDVMKVDEMQGKEIEVYDVGKEWETKEEIQNEKEIQDKEKERQEDKEEQPQQEEESGSNTSIDGLTFHEVGQENDLRSLVSPTNESPAREGPFIPPISALELLHVFAEKSSKKSQKIKRRTSNQYLLARKPIDLVSIPEGEYVNCYNEFQDSQLFDNDLLYSLMPFAFHSDAFLPAPPPSSPHEPHPPKSSDLSEPRTLTSSDVSLSETHPLISSELHPLSQSQPHPSLKQAWDSLPAAKHSSIDNSTIVHTNSLIVIPKIKTSSLSSSPTITSKVPLKTSIFEFGGRLNH